MNNNFTIEYLAALELKKTAENNFNNADIEYIDVAIHQYNAAVERINTIVKRMKGSNNNETRKINL